MTKNIKILIGVASVGGALAVLGTSSVMAVKQGYQAAQVDAEVRRIVSNDQSQGRQGGQNFATMNENTEVFRGQSQGQNSRGSQGGSQKCSGQGSHQGGGQGSHQGGGQKGGQQGKQQGGSQNANGQGQNQGSNDGGNFIDTNNDGECDHKE